MFAISQSVADDLMQKKHVHSIVNPNGIKPELIRTDKRSSDGKFRIVQVSRLDHPKKGQHILLEACGMLKQRGYDNFTVDFIGGGPSLEYLKSVTEKSQLCGRVNFLGMKDQQYIYMIIFANMTCSFNQVSMRASDLLWQRRWQQRFLFLSHQAKGQRR